VFPSKRTLDFSWRVNTRNRVICEIIVVLILTNSALLQAHLCWCKRKRLALSLAYRRSGGSRTRVRTVARRLIWHFFVPRTVSVNGLVHFCWCGNANKACAGATGDVSVQVPISLVHPPLCRCKGGFGRHTAIAAEIAAWHATSGRQGDNPARKPVRTFYQAGIGSRRSRRSCWASSGLPVRLWPSGGPRRAKRGVSFAQTGPLGCLAGLGAGGLGRHSQGRRLGRLQLPFPPIRVRCAHRGHVSRSSIILSRPVANLCAGLAASNSPHIMEPTSSVTGRCHKPLECKNHGQQSYLSSTQPAPSQHPDGPLGDICKAIESIFQKHGLHCHTAYAGGVPTVIAHRTEEWDEQ
jgi:hypothetical protein